MKDVVILHWNTLTSPDHHARRIAEFLGAEVTVVSLAAAPNAGSLQQRVPRCTALIVHIETLVRVAAELDDGPQGLLELTALATHVFIYGFQPTHPHSLILQVLSLGSLTAVERLTTSEATFCVADTDRQRCGPFTGLSIQGADPTRDACFVDAPPRPGKTALVRVADRPFFVCVDHSGSHVFFLACTELADLDERVLREASLVPWFSRLIPLMIFLRNALGDRLWHSEDARACFIIDDPLLKNRYGFLEYRRLLEAIGKTKFSVCIAFIPWNYWRSSKQVADLFSGATRTLSLAVHGCDHTRAELAATACELLYGKARLGLARMRLHRDISGIPFDNVMVLPYGLFSPQALEVLSACGYLAAIGAGLIPSDIPQALTLRHLLDAAITSFGDFPLFMRLRPVDIPGFAFALFLGKPALLVAHHDYFGKGYEALTNLSKQLNDLDDRLEWSNLGNVCSRVCLKRVTPQGDVHVRFYTDRFWLANNGTRTQTFLLSRRRTPKGPLPEVTVNGRPHAREQRNDTLVFNLSLDPGQQADIRILPRPPATAAPDLWQPTFAYRAKVFVACALREIRDNYVHTNRLLAALLSRVYNPGRQQPDDH
jgi:hypothetical protein